MFRVPTESPNASTVKLEVDLPTTTPFASVAVRPNPGWSFAVATSKLAKPIMTDDGDTVTEADSRITWTANPGQGIRPGEFDEFAISVGPLPNAGSVQFRAIQTYSDGSVVRWTQTAAPGAPEPENPAPTLPLPTSGSSATDAAAVSNPSTSTGTSGGSGGGHGDTALAVAALVVGVGGLLTGGAALVIARRTRSSGHGA